MPSTCSSLYSCCIACMPASQEEGMPTQSWDSEVAKSISLSTTFIIVLSMICQKVSPTAMARTPGLLSSGINLAVVKAARCSGTTSSMHMHLAKAANAVHNGLTTSCNRSSSGTMRPHPIQKGPMSPTSASWFPERIPEYSRIAIIRTSIIRTIDYPEWPAQCRSAIWVHVFIYMYNVHTMLFGSFCFWHVHSELYVQVWIRRPLSEICNKWSIKWGAHTFYMYEIVCRVCERESGTFGSSEPLGPESCLE